MVPGRGRERRGIARQDPSSIAVQPEPQLAARIDDVVAPARRRVALVGVEHHQERSNPGVAVERDVGPEPELHGQLRRTQVFVDRQRDEVIVAVEAEGGADLAGREADAVQRGVPDVAKIDAVVGGRPPRQQAGGRRRTGEGRRRDHDRFAHEVVGLVRLVHGAIGIDDDADVVGARCGADRNRQVLRGIEDGPVTGDSTRQRRGQEQRIGGGDDRVRRQVVTESHDDRAGADRALIAQRPGRDRDLAPWRHRQRRTRHRIALDQEIGFVIVVVLRGRLRAVGFDRAEDHVGGRRLDERLHRSRLVERAACGERLEADGAQGDLHLVGQRRRAQIAAHVVSQHRRGGGAILMTVVRRDRERRDLRRVDLGRVDLRVVDRVDLRRVDLRHRDVRHHLRFLARDRLATAVRARLVSGHERRPRDDELELVVAAADQLERVRHVEQRFIRTGRGAGVPDRISNVRPVQLPWRDRVDLRRIDLRRGDLRTRHAGGVDLGRVDLRRIDLRRVDLRIRPLRRVDALGRDLRRVDLRVVQLGVVRGDAVVTGNHRRHADQRIVVGVRIEDDARRQAVRDQRPAWSADLADENRDRRRRVRGERLDPYRSVHA